MSARAREVLRVEPPRPARRAEGVLNDPRVGLADEVIERRERRPVKREHISRRGRDYRVTRRHRVEQRLSQLSSRQMPERESNSVSNRRVAFSKLLERQA